MPRPTPTSHAHLEGSFGRPRGHQKHYRHRRLTDSPPSVLPPSPPSTFSYASLSPSPSEPASTQQPSPAMALYGPSTHTHTHTAHNLALQHQQHAHHPAVFHPAAHAQSTPVEFVRAHAKGTVRFRPFEHGLDAETRAGIAEHGVFPFGQIEEYCRHIPYASGKKDFFEKTGRESFEVFQYVFRVRGDDKEYHVMWDYNVGLVRMTPFFKVCKYSKTTPAKMLGLNPGLREITHSITGGSIMAQGYWMPYACARAVCATFCFHIAPALVPIFGPDFPAQCLPPQSPDYGRMVIDRRLVAEATRETEHMRQLQLQLQLQMQMAPSLGPSLGHVHAHDHAHAHAHDDARGPALAPLQYRVPPCGPVPPSPVERARETLPPLSQIAHLGMASDATLPPLVYARTHASRHALPRSPRRPRGTSQDRVHAHALAYATTNADGDRMDIDGGADMDAYPNRQVHVTYHHQPPASCYPSPPRRALPYKAEDDDWASPYHCQPYPHAPRRGPSTSTSTSRPWNTKDADAASLLATMRDTRAGASISSLLCDESPR